MNHPTLHLRRAGRLAALALACLPGLAAAGSGNWTTTGPYGGTVNRLAVYEAAPSTLFAAGSGGLFRSVNNGSTWQRSEVGIAQANAVTGLAVATQAPVAYVATGSRVYRTGNAGDLWVPLPPTSNYYISGISLRRGGTSELALATYDGVLVSADGGNTWTGPGSTVGSMIGAVAHATDGILYAGLYYSTGVSFGSAVVVRSNDGGASWSPTATQPDTSLLTQLVTSPTDAQVILASDGSQLYVSNDRGATWATKSPPIVGGVSCGIIDSLTASPGSSAEVFIGCRFSGVHRTTNINAVDPVWTTWGSASGLSVNGADPVQASAIVLHPSFPAITTVWIGTMHGGVLRSTNGGASWSAINTNLQSVNVRALATHPVDTGPGAVILAGQGDSYTTTRPIQRSADAGASWESAITGLNAEQIRSIAIDPTTVDTNPLTAENFTVYAAGRAERIPSAANKDAGVYKSVDGGNTWATIDTGILTTSGVRDMGTVRTVALDPRSCAAPPPSGPCPIGSGPLKTVFAAGGGVLNFFDPSQPPLSARIYKSTDAGAHWTASDNGLPTGQMFDDDNYVVLGGVNPVVFDPTNTQTIYIGTFISYGADPDSGLVPTIPSGVFKSTDGGATWVHRSDGLPRYFGPGSTQQDVLALAISPNNPQVLYAAASDTMGINPSSGSVYKTVDGGANWFEIGAGIAGQDVRALFIDPADPSGNTVYAGSGGDSANPGGVYRTTDGGVTWNSFSIGLPAYSATALAMPARATGAPPRLLAGTSAGVWDFTALPDEDADGVPTAIENDVRGGDGNGDGIPDAQQSNVASLSAPASNAAATNALNANIEVTAAIVGAPGGCTRLNDVTTLQASLYPPDPRGNATSHDPWGLVRFALPACPSATVRVTFHGAAFGPGWIWRNYGPRTPGNLDSFGWYSFGGARRVDAQTWELTLDALRQGNYRNDGNNLLFIGGPGQFDDLLFDHGFD